MRNLIYVALCASVAACGSDDVDSDEEARRAYLGLDGSIEKSIALGFAGFNAASSANIDAQMTTGVAAGTLTINGQVDQGASTNKGMRLFVGMVDYDDGDVSINDDGDTIHIVYNTTVETTTQPALNLQLKNFPDGMLEGTLIGNYQLGGDIEGELTLNLTISGTTMAGTVAGDVVRVPGTTTITGTATNSDGGNYDISLSI